MGFCLFFIVIYCHLTFKMNQISASLWCSTLLIIFGVSLFGFMAAFLYAICFEPHCSPSLFYYKIQNVQQGNRLQRLQHNHTSLTSK